MGDGRYTPGERIAVVVIALALSIGFTVLIWWLM